MSFSDPIDALEEQLASHKEQPGVKSENMSPSQILDSPAYTNSAFLDQGEDGNLFMDKFHAAGSYPDFDDLNSRSPSVQAYGNNTMNSNGFNDINSSNPNSQTPFFGSELEESNYKFGRRPYSEHDSDLMYANQSSNHQQLNDHFQNEQFADQQYSIPSMPGINSSSMSPSAMQQRLMPSGNIQRGNIQSGNIQSGNTHPGNMQSGNNVQSGGVHSNVQPGNIESGGMHPGMHPENILPGNMHPGTMHPNNHGNFVPSGPNSTSLNRNPPAYTGFPSGNGNPSVHNSDINPQYTSPFKIDLDMVRRTMKGVNEALNVDLSGTEVTESALKDNPNEDADSEKDTTSPKSEMSHVRLISDACGYIVVSVAKAVLEAAKDSAADNILRGRPSFPPKPPIRKKRGGVLGFKELANRASLSPWHFHRVFRFVTGVTPKAYGEALWEYLMIQAGFDLSNEDLTITQALERKGGAKDVAHALSGKASNSSSSTTGSPQSPNLGPNALLSNNANTSTNTNSGANRTSTVNGNALPGNSSQNSGAASLSNNAYPVNMDSNNGGASAVSTAGVASQANAATYPPGTGVSSGSNSLPNSGAQDTHSSSPNQSTVAGSKPGGQNLVPLSGTVAPGRVRKASSRSRGARSRSRNRSQTQNQILSSLSMEPGSTNEGSVLSRGRSFSRVTQRPYLTSDPKMPPYYANGSAISDNTAGTVGSTSPDSSVPMPTGDGLMNNLNADLTPGNIGINPNVPDLNSLTLQQIEHPMNQMEMGAAGPQVDYSTMNMDFNNPYYNQYGNLDGAQFYPMNNQLDFVNSNNSAPGVSPSNIDTSNGSPAGASGAPSDGASSRNASSSRSRRPSSNRGRVGQKGIVSDGDISRDVSSNSANGLSLVNGNQNSVYAQEQYDNAMNFLSSPSDVGSSVHSHQNSHFAPPSYENSELANTHGENNSVKNNISAGHAGFAPGFDDSHRGVPTGSKEDSPSNSQSPTVNLKSTSQDSAPPTNSSVRRMKDLAAPQGIHHHANSFHSIENPLSSIRESFDPPVDTLHDDHKYDRYGDLPDYYFSHGAEHPLDDDYSNPDAYLSALVGEEDPPLLPSWNADNQNEFAYQY